MPAASQANAPIAWIGWFAGLTLGSHGEEPGDIELGQGPGKPVGADETQVVAGHGGLLRLWLRARVASDEAPEFCAFRQG